MFFLNILHYFSKCMFTNSMLRLCQSDCFCVDAKCTYFAHSMLHLAVITNDILKIKCFLGNVFDWRVTDCIYICV